MPKRRAALLKPIRLSSLTMARVWLPAPKNKCVKPGHGDRSPLRHFKLKTVRSASYSEGTIKPTHLSQDFRIWLAPARIKHFFLSVSRRRAEASLLLRGCQKGRRDSIMGKTWFRFRSLY